MKNGNLNWVITVVLVPLVFGAYIYTYAVEGKAEDRAQTLKEETRQLATGVKEDNEQRAQEIKKDLKEQITQSEQRVREALNELKEIIQKNR